jgi:hypothetical protein
MLRRDFIRRAATVGATTGLAVLLGHAPGDQGASSGRPQPPSDSTPDPDSGDDSGSGSEKGSGSEQGPGPDEPDPEVETPTVPSVLRPGDSGDTVLGVQSRLGQLGYWCGTPDGHYGGLTTSAVTALQKASGLTRDGLCGPATTRALDAGTRPAASTHSGHVIEIHRDTQVLLVVDSGRVGTILATCTGSEVPYQSEGRTWSARTTPGSYHVYYRKEGWDHGPLGDLYRPMFFNGGIAVHGSRSVPPYPASHGCCRLTIPAMDMILARGLISMGTAVVVY